LRERLTLKLRTLAEQLQRFFDAGEWIANVMGKHGRELAQGRQAFGPGQLLL